MANTRSGGGGGGPAGSGAPRDGHTTPPPPASATATRKLPNARETRGTTAAAADAHTPSLRRSTRETRGKNKYKQLPATTSSHRSATRLTRDATAIATPISASSPKRSARARNTSGSPSPLSNQDSNGTSTSAPIAKRKTEDDAQTATTQSKKQKRLMNTKRYIALFGPEESPKSPVLAIPLREDKENASKMQAQDDAAVLVDEESNAQEQVNREPSSGADNKVLEGHSSDLHEMPEVILEGDELKIRSHQSDLVSEHPANHPIGGYVPPSYNKLRTTLLVQEKTNVERLMQPIKATWNSKGLSIVSDGWSDAQRRPLLNFLAVTEDGPMFLKAINTEGISKTKEYISEKMLAVIDEVRAQNVVQVITDNAANCRAAGIIVEQKHPQIFWTPCVVHTLNLALKNICAPRDIDDELYDEFQWISEIIGDASCIKNFIMNHSMRLSMFNEHSKLKFLAIAETRFASAVVMLKRFVAIKDALSVMVVSEKWTAYREDNPGPAQFVKDKIVNDVWWDKVRYFLSFIDPIYSMVRAADTDKPCLHLIYEMWDTMIEKVKNVIYRYEGKEAHEESTFYSAVQDILVSRWTKSNTPLHCLAHSLNPKYYTEAWINEIPNRQAPHNDEEISEMRNACFRRYFSGEELKRVKQQYANFSLFGPGFNSFDSLEDRTYMDPKQWWGIHGHSTPELKKLALRLLGHPTSSSCDERNWSTYGLIHSSLRNRLNPARAEDLVFTHQNLRLLSRKTEEYNCGPSVMWDIGADTFESDFEGGADFLEHADLSLDEPELERVLEDLGAMGLTEDA